MLNNKEAVSLIEVSKGQWEDEKLLNSWTVQSDHNSWELSEVVSSSLYAVLESVTMTPLWWVWDWNNVVSLTWSSTKIKIKRKWYQPFNLIIDLWMYQWWDEMNNIKLNSELPFNPSKIDAVVVTHAHLDHIWRLPMLINWDSPFKWPLYATKVTSLLMLLSLDDSAKIMKENLDSIQDRATKLKKFLSRQLSDLKDLELALNNWKEIKSRSRYSKIKQLKATHTRQSLNNRQEEIRALLWEYWVKNNSDISKIFSEKILNAKNKVLYSEDDVKRLYSHIKQTWFYKREEIAPWVFLTFLKASHILWSSQVILEIDKWNWEMLTMWFSWDIWRFFNPMYLWKPDIPNYDFDTYQIESTYWDRLHTNKQEEEKRMISLINEIYRKKGKIVIPCFMIQRLQDVSVLLIKMMENWDIPKMDIYYDWAYVSDINNVFRFSDNKNYKYLESSVMKHVGNDTKNNKFLKAKWPCILVSPSWMMNWWSIQKYVEPILSDAKNALFIVWYQAQWTLWRKILEKKPGELIDMVWVWSLDIKSRVESFWCFSWHWDKDDLYYLMSELSLKEWWKVIVNHWEKWKSQKALIDTLTDAWIWSPIASEVWNTIKIY